MTEQPVTDHTFPVHVDERGSLLAVEGDDVGFEIRRVFTVTGAEGAPSRGGHVTGCAELLVLVTGAATVVRRRSTGETSSHRLAVPGQSLRLAPSDHVDFALDGPGSVLLVLSDRAFEDVSR